MRILRIALAVLIAIMATWALTTATTAQSSIPNGVFVQDSDGFVWLVLDGQRVNVPVWQATDAEIAAVPQSDRWAVANEAGAIAAGASPSWLQVGGNSLLTGQHPPLAPLPSQRVHVVEGGDTLNRIAQRYGVSVETIMQANGFTDRNRVFRIGERLLIPDAEAAGPPLTLNPSTFAAPPGHAQPPESGRATMVEGVMGQQAIGTAPLSRQRIKASVRSMLIARLLSSTMNATDTRLLQVDDQRPSGMFVIVEVDVENIGSQPSCCLPRFRLRDSRGRYFSGETSEGEPPVKAARFWFHPDIPWNDMADDYQPNLPKRRVFVYDVPTDSTGFVLSPDEFTR